MTLSLLLVIAVAGALDLPLVAQRFVVPDGIGLCVSQWATIGFLDSVIAGGWKCGANPLAVEYKKPMLKADDNRCEPDILEGSIIYRLLGV